MAINHIHTGLLSINPDENNTYKKYHEQEASQEHQKRLENNVKREYDKIL